MWDNSAPGRWRFPFRITSQVLGVALTVSLAFLAYLLLRPDVRAVAFSPMSQSAHAAAAQRAVAAAASDGTLTSQAQGSPGGIAASAQISPTAEVSTTSTSSTGLPTTMNMDPAVAGPASTPAPENIDAVLGQLQEMQRALQAASDQLGLRASSGAPLPVLPASAGTASSGAASPGGTSVSEADVSAMMTEIDQLYQVMQPLMERLQNASQSSRSPSELAAMRTQMDDIHRRLTLLMQRVQAAKAATTASSQSVLQTQSGANNGGPSNQVNPDQATLDQLRQSTSQLQRLLQQMQSGAAPNGQ